MKHNYRFFFLVALLLLPQMPVWADGDTLASGQLTTTLDWALTSDGTLRLTGSGAMPDFTYPDYGPWYSYRSQVLTLELPEGLTGIGKYAFYMLENLSSPLIIPEGVTSLGYCAFSASYKLTSVTLPTTLQTIESNVFQENSKLESLYIPASVSSIGSGNTSGCVTLTSLVVDPANTVFTSENGSNVIIKQSTNTLVAGCKTSVIPSYVTTIATLAFGSIRTMTSLTIPENVTSIEDYAFQYCNSLASITSEAVTPPTLGRRVFTNVDKTIPLYVPSNGITAYQADSAWSEFTNFQAIGSDSGTGTDSTQTDDTFEVDGLYYQIVATQANAVEVIRNPTASSNGYSGDIVIPETISVAGAVYDVVGIAYNAFTSCYNMTSIYIPASVTSIEDGSFLSTTALRSITISPANTVYNSGDGANAIIETATNRLMVGCRTTVIPSTVTSIGNSAFNFCSAMEAIEIPNSVTMIGDYAFYWCESLSTITIPSSVISIGNDAFEQCTGLTSFTCEAETPPYLGTDAFLQVTNTIPLYVPANSVSLYQADQGWSYFRNIKAIGDTTSTEPEGCYLAYGDLSTTMTWVLTCDHVLQITGTGNMPNFSYPDYGPWYTTYRDSIYAVEISDGVTALGEYAFYGLGHVTNLYIPEGVTLIDYCALASMYELSTVSFPTTLQTIDDGVLSSDWALKSLYIPASVTSIGSRLTESTGVLSSIVVDEANPVYNSGDGANAIIVTATNTLIAGCAATVIPETVTTIGNNAFSALTGLTSITIPASVTSIESYAFSYCSKLTEIYCLSESPASVGNNAFKNVTTKATLYVPDYSVSTYQEAAGWSEFTNIQALPISGTCGENLTWTFTSSDSTLTITGTGAMYDYGEETVSPDGGPSNGGQMAPWFEQEITQSIYHLSLPEGLTSIGSYAFCYISNLSSVDIPSTVTSIGAQAFAQCDELTECTVAESGITEIGEYAFNYCQRLVTFDIPSTVTTIGQGAFQSCTNLHYAIIPAGVTTIQPNTFYSCQMLSTVYLYDGLQTIGNSAFNACKRLTKITLPSTVTSIGENAFEYCEMLSSVDLSENLTSIGSLAFYACPFSSIELPATLTSIGYGAFMSCSNIAAVTSLATTPPTIQSEATGATADAFPDAPDSLDITVPAGTVSLYQAAPGWTRYTNIHTGNPSGTCGDNLTWEFNPNDSSLTISGTGAMTDYSAQDDIPWYAYHDDIVVLNLPEGLTTIGDKAFYSITNLTEVTIPNGVTSIGNYAFTNCTGLKTVVLPTNLTTIGNQAFYRCLSLESISLPLGVISIGQSAFTSDSSLVSVTIPNSVTEIGGNAFNGCGMTSVTIPASVTSFGDKAFANCSSLTEMLVDSDNTIYDSRDNCNAIIETATNTLIQGCKNSTIPNGITALGDYAFENCMNLESITIPSSVTTIGSSAFYLCVGLTSITCEAITPPDCGPNNYVFWNVDKDKCVLYVPYGSIDAYQQVTQWKAFTNMRAIPCDDLFESTEAAEMCYGSVFVWHDKELTEAGEYQDTLKTDAGCDSIVTLNLTYAPSYGFVDSMYVCESDLPFIWHDREFMTGGDYSDSLETAFGCDSIYNLHLEILTIPHSYDTAQFCYGESYTWNSQTYTAQGDYETTIRTQDGCDSVAHLHLVENPIYFYSDTINLCEDMPYDWHGRSIKTTGIYYDSLQSVYGCDSIYELVATIHPNFFHTTSQTVCEGTPYIWHDREFTESGIYYDSLISHMGCDSVYELILTVDTKQLVDDSITVCEGKPAEWRGKTYYEAGVYRDTVRHSVSGCDSIVYTLHLTVNPNKTAEENAVLCQGETFTWNGNEYTETGDYSVTLSTIHGCDSVVTLHLTVYPTYYFEETGSTCEGTLYVWHNREYATAGIYYDSLTTIHGCDSIYRLTLTVRQTYTSEESVTVCVADLPYEWNGLEYTEAGDYQTTLTAQNGCDSVVTLHLNVQSAVIYTEERTICDIDLPFSWHGNVYPAAGVYYDTIRSVLGCDSNIYVLTLTVNPSYTNDTMVTICSSDLPYLWHGHEYYESGDYNDTLQTIQGCDSIITLHVTVNQTYATEDSATICQGESYNWNGQVYTETGDYQTVLMALNGCDSVVTLHLTVNQTYATDITAEICEGESYAWYGEEYTMTGDYETTLASITGCDSLVTLHLTVQMATYAFVEDWTTCESSLPYIWRGKSIAAEGTYFDTLRSTTGCDSMIYTLNLTIQTAIDAPATDTTVCEGDATLMWRGKVWPVADTAYFDTVRYAETGCDNMRYTLNVTVNRATYAPAEDWTICENSLPFSWRDMSITAAGTYYDTTYYASGCVSAYYTLNLTVNSNYETEESATICESELPYIWHGQEYNETGDYETTLASITGCDSLVTLHLTVLQATDATAEDSIVCEADMPIMWHGKSIAAAGIYYDTVRSTTGCDSLRYTLNLTVLTMTYAPAIDTTVCEGDATLMWRGKVWPVADTTYYDTQYYSISGCDSALYTLNVTVNRATYAPAEDWTICENSLPFSWRDMSITAAGTYYDTTYYASGCVSAYYTLNLTVNSNYETEESATICESEVPYIWHGENYYQTGDYETTLASITGCDSIVTLHLTVQMASDAAAEDWTICESSLPFTWRGMSITAAGTYHDTVRYATGCDSLRCTLNLTVNDTYQTTEEAAICEGETYTWHGRALTKKGTYVDTIPSMQGCDSVCTLILTVNEKYLIEDIVSIREDKLPYMWQGDRITQAGDYRKEYTSIYGCDSVHTLHLVVTALPIYTVNVIADHGRVNGTGTYAEGTLIHLEAVPDEGFEFQMWSDGSDVNPKDFVVTQDTTLRAHFFMPEVEQEVTVDSIETTSVTIVWDTVPGATLYELRIYKNGELVVTYEVDPDNNIVGEHHIGPDRLVARKDSTGGSSETLQVNVGGLDPGSDYTYSLDALDDDRSYVGAQSGSFTTEEDETDLRETLFDDRRPEPRKVFRDGQLYIEMPDGTRYSPEGHLLE